MQKVCFFVLVIVVLNILGQSRTLIYDEKKGIIFLDQQNASEQKQQQKLPPPSLPEPKKKSHRELIIGREKDPPKEYFKTGLKFFESGDFVTAQKNFAHANSVDPQPLYMLWMGKCYRQTGQNEEMLKIMNTILDKHSSSDVADDALFEIAFYNQSNGDYHKAMEDYRRLAEQYPYGKSYSGELDFLKIAREQIRFMRTELLTYLTELDIKGRNFEEGIKNFQKKKDLAQTGKPDQNTVKSIKEEYNSLLQVQRKQEKAKEAAKRYVYYIVAAGLLAIVIIVFMIYMRIILKEKIAHLDIMEQIVSDMGKGKP